jgi:hypothetical protein
LVWARKEPAALVLSPVSAANVVEGMILAGVGDGTGAVGVWLPPPPQAWSVRIKPSERAATNKRFVGPDFIATQAGNFASLCSRVMLPVNRLVYRAMQPLKCLAGEPVHEIPFRI